MTASSARAYRALLPALLGSYFLVALASALLRADAFLLGKADTALTLDSLWQAGRLMNPVSYAEIWEVSYFAGSHVIPMGFAYGLLYRLMPWISTALCLHTASFTVSGLFLYLACKEISGRPSIALILAANYLFCYTPPIHQIYPEDWAAPYLSAALYFTLKRRFPAATLCWVAAMMFKEYIGLAIAAHAACLALALRLGAPSTGEPKRRARVRTFLAWALLCAAWSLFCLLVLMPWLQPDWSQMRAFSALGGSRSEALLRLVTMPEILLGRVFSAHTLRHLWSLLSPSALLSLGGPEYLAALPPILTLNLLLDDFCAKAAAGANQHYTTMLQPFITVAAALGTRRLLACASRARRAVGAALLGWAVLQSVVGARLHLYYLKQGLLLSHAFMPHSRDLRAVLDGLPADASVSADSEHILPFLAGKDLTHPSLVAQRKPRYFLADGFYRNPMEPVVAAAMASGWRSLRESPRERYAATGACPPAGYAPVLTRGSVTLCESARAEGAP